MERLLLHVCCANCGLVPIEMLKQKFALVLFWYNPNIQPIEEYDKRLENFYQLAKIYNLDYLIGPDDSDCWDQIVRKNSLTDEPEGGQRCTTCFRWRLNATAQTAQRNEAPRSLLRGIKRNPPKPPTLPSPPAGGFGRFSVPSSSQQPANHSATEDDFSYFATTLGISRYKNTELIDRLGQEATQQYQAQYYPLKTNKGLAAQRELKLSKTYNFYRQKYCGCLYSKTTLAKNLK